MASEIAARFPDIELHASTQASAHSTDGCRFLEKLGFSRAVIARELDRDAIARICQTSPIETEIFIHGALCVSHSGQCLFSSMVGGRSGNRGECAQPCRLPYSGGYPLSLKDNCLAGSFAEILSLGAASLKIEGRMKSPDYVYGVTKIYRRLIDEKRNATADELDRLAALFSRSGFTDGYYKGKLDRRMNGIRTKEDKLNAAKSEPFDTESVKKKLALTVSIKVGKPAYMKLEGRFFGETVSAEVFSDIPETAVNAPLTRERVEKQLTKLGATDFNCDPERTEITVDNGLMLPISTLNALRRDAVRALCEKLVLKRRVPAPQDANTAQTVRTEHTAPSDNYTPKRTARFLSASQITAQALEYFDIVYLPLESFSAPANGVILPPVITDREADKVALMLRKAEKLGALHVLVSNIGQLESALASDLRVHGDFRLNVTESKTSDLFLSFGLEDIIPSPEMSLKSIAHSDQRLRENTIIYGRIPLMLLEKCVNRDISDCKRCTDGKCVLIDRVGEKFPVFRTFEHRNIIYNSRATYMADRSDVLTKHRIRYGHFIFTDETAQTVDRIINAYINGSAPNTAVRRVK